MKEVKFNKLLSNQILNSVCEKNKNGVTDSSRHISYVPVKKQATLSIGIKQFNQIDDINENKYDLVKKSIIDLLVQEIAEKESISIDSITIYDGYDNQCDFELGLVLSSLYPTINLVYEKNDIINIIKCVFRDKILFRDDKPESSTDLKEGSVVALFNLYMTERHNQILDKKVFNDEGWKVICKLAFIDDSIDNDFYNDLKICLGEHSFDKCVREVSIGLVNDSIKHVFIKSWNIVNSLFEYFNFNENKNYKAYRNKDFDYIKSKLGELINIKNSHIFSPIDIVLVPIDWNIKEVIDDCYDNYIDSSLEERKLAIHNLFVNSNQLDNKMVGISLKHGSNSSMGRAKTFVTDENNIKINSDEEISSLYECDLNKKEVKYLVNSNIESDKYDILDYFAKQYDNYHNKFNNEQLNVNYIKDCISEQIIGNNIDIIENYRKTDDISQANVCLFDLIVRLAVKYSIFKHLYYIIKDKSNHDALKDILKITLCKYFSINHPYFVLVGDNDSCHIEYKQIDNIDFGDLDDIKVLVNNTSKSSYVTIQTASFKINNEYKVGKLMLRLSNSVLYKGNINGNTGIKYMCYIDDSNVKR